MKRKKSKGSYRDNHYVPQWYQRRFMPEDQGQKELFRLNLKPRIFCGGDGVSRSERAESRQPTKKLFVQEDLYTTEINGISNTEIEQFFFGRIDDQGKRAIALLTEFPPTTAELPDFNHLMLFLSTQKLRTPKGLSWLATQTSTHRKVDLLVLLQRLQKVFGAIWIESVWQIVDASQSATKFIVSDNPVTAYNRECPPGSPNCGEIDDPDIRLTGTHTIYPLSFEKALILTNLSWVRNPYESAQTLRPNPLLHRSAMIKWTSIQTRRLLSEEEVLQMNYIIKSRAVDYIAAAKSEWLYPEKHLKSLQWDSFSHGYLLMPDPREVPFTREILIGYKDGAATAFDEYGRRPWESAYKDEKRADQEQVSFRRFEGEYARLYGRKLRGQNSEFFDRPKREEVSEELHQAHLEQERRFSFPAP